MKIDKIKDNRVLPYAYNQFVQTDFSQDKMVNPYLNNKKNSKNKIYLLEKHKNVEDESTSKIESLYIELNEEQELLLNFLGDHGFLSAKEIEVQNFVDDNEESTFNVK